MYVSHSRDPSEIPLAYKRLSLLYDWFCCVFSVIIIPAQGDQMGFFYPFVLFPPAPIGSNPPHFCVPVTQSVELLCQQHAVP